MVPMDRTGLVADVRRMLADAGDPERARQQAAYMKSAMPFHGVAKSELDALLRPLLGPWPFTDRHAWETTILDLWDDAGHREERYAALAIARHRRARPWQEPSMLTVHRHLVVSGAWWDLVDEIATRLVGPLLLEHRETATPVLARWAVDDDLWLRRTAILSQLKHRDQTDERLLRHTLVANLEPSRYGGEFFIRKAIGWALREYSKTDAGWVRGFLVEHDDELSALSRREASKYLRPD